MYLTYKLKSPHVTLIIFLILFATILAFFWLRVEVDNSSIEGVCEAYKGSDIFTYCTVGTEFAAHGFRAFIENMGSFIFWPPGQFLNFAAAAFFIGTKSPVFNFMVMHIYLLWLVCLITIGYICNLKFGKIGYLIPLTFFLLPEFNHFLSVTSVYLSDPCGAVYFIAGMSLLMFAKPSLKVSIISGILLVVSAYYRSPNEAAIMIMLLGTIAAILYATAKEFFSSKIKFRTAFVDNIKINKFLLISLLIAVTLTMPWRAFTYVYDNHRLMWTRNFPMEVLVHWYEPSTTPQWLADGGGAMACKFAPEVCKTFHEPDSGYNIPGKTRELFKVILKHPVPWVAQRTQIFIKQWLMPYNGEQSLLLNEAQQSLWLKSLRMLLLVVFFVYPVYVCLTFLFGRTKHDVTRVVLLGSSLVMVGLMLVVVHVEARYLYPYKLLAFLYVADFCLMLKEHGFSFRKRAVSKTVYQ